jgi:hypothetical protein
MERPHLSRQTTQELVKAPLTDPPGIEDSDQDDLMFRSIQPWLLDLA